MNRPTDETYNVETYQRQYKQRYCAFIDVLGFSHLVTRIGSDVPVLKVIGLLTRLSSAVGPYDYEPTEFESTSISDAIVISTADNVEGLVCLLAEIHELALDVLNAGYFIRGAVVKGLLYHHLNTVVGEALLRAIHIEREIVRYPRVLVSRDVSSQIDGSLGPDLGLLRHAEDGPSFLHVLRTYNDDVLSTSSRTDLGKPADRQAIHANITTRLAESRDNPRHFEKVKWFAQYWNDIADEGSIEGMLRVVGAGLGAASRSR